MKSSEKKVFSLLLLILLITLGCKDVFDPNNFDGEITPPFGMGSFSLRIDNANVRTILPTTTQGDFVAYRLVFTGTASISEDRTAANYSAPVYLPVGTYNLTVTAYLDTGMTKPVAQGSASGIIIGTGNVTRSITLTALIGSGAGPGTFSWAITFPDEVTTATMKITPVDPVTGTAETTINLLGGNAPNVKSGSLSLNSGYYKVLFTITKPKTKTLEWLEALHIYQNLESYCERNFGNEYFNNNIYTVTFNYNYDNFEITESVIHGNKINEPTPAPTRSGYSFGGWFTDAACTVSYNFDTPVSSSFLLYSKWDTSNFTVTNTVEWNSTLYNIKNGNGKAYTITVSGGIINVPGSSTVDTSFGSMTDITVTLQGTGTLILESTGSILRLGTNQTLIIDDENLILQGIPSNNNPVIYVQSGGILELKKGAIKGNTNKSTDTVAAGGGVNVTTGGVFNMSGGTISENIAECPVAGGGGVCISGGTFTMYGNAQVFDNFSSYYGGGVYLEGNFIMKGNASVHSNRAAIRGGGVYAASSSNFTMQENTSVYNNEGGSYGYTGNGDGGGVFVNFSNFTMQGESSVYDNRATGSSGYYGNGGGVFINGGNFRIQDNALVYGNTAYLFGGGVYIHRGDLIIAGGKIYGSNVSTTFNNTSNEEGGSISRTVGNGGTAKYSDNSNILLPNMTWISPSGGNNIFCYYTNDTIDFNGVSNTIYPTGHIFNVATAIQWDNALKGIGHSASSNNSTYTINVTANIIVSNFPVNTFYGATGVSVTITGNQTISLATGTTGCLLSIGAGQSVVLHDIILQGHSANTSPLVGLSSNISPYPSLTMQGNATVTGNINTNFSGSAGGVSIYHGIFTMKDNSKVTNNTVTGWNAAAGGVMFTGSSATTFYGTFVMEGNAQVSGNTGVNCGGGVYIGNSGGAFGKNFFTMRDNAIVDNNTAINGGGVYISSSGFNMQGNASITNNTATGAIGGGGVYLYGKFNMNNGIISGNKANNGSGGGVYITDSWSELTMSGGTIYGNDASPTTIRNTSGNGAAIYVNTGSAKYSNGDDITASGSGINSTIQMQ